MNVVKWDMSMAHRCFERTAKTYVSSYNKLIKGKAFKKSSQAGEWDDFRSEINRGIAKRRR
jgi:hypothetical protein